MIIIHKPVITEKMTGQSDKYHRYGFYVDRRANKLEIKDAVEKTYNVTVTNVRTLNMPGKVKRRTTRAGVREGRIGKFKKAVVTLKENDTIDFYSAI
ncbi:MAG: 50S ribosomal protein L23 [Bacteroidia bacterium]|nr:50S ribosomal protein L23 [Bacteroidia bacterium]